jgi:hypothetical protein
MKKLPVYKLVMNDELENSGVNMIALVDEPAIKTNWFAFENKIKFSADKKRQMVTMPIMIADLPIYRRDAERGEYYVVFDASQIEKIQQKFMKTNQLHNVNEMHDSDKKVGGVYLVNSFVTDKEMGIEAPKMFSDMPYGTWFGTYKIDNLDTWNKALQGEFNGVSVEFVGELVDEKLQMENKIKQLINEIIQ